MNEQQEIPAWITYINRRIEKNKNFLGFVSGPTGSGKSMACLRIAEMLDPEFSMERCVFSGLELMKLINSQKLKKGSVIVWEEMGVGMSNRNWLSATNKMLSFLMQTFRHRNFILLMNSPFMDFVDAGTRRLFHAEFEMKGINFTTKMSRIKPFTLQYNGQNKKLYRKYLRVRREGKGYTPLTRWNIGLANKNLLEEYEVKKFAFTNNLNTTIMGELNKIDKPAKNTELTDRQEVVLKLLRKGLTIKQISIELKKHVTAIYASVKSIKRKGITLKPIHNGSDLQGYEVLDSRDTIRAASNAPVISTLHLKE